MTDTQIFEPDGRAIPFAVEGEGPVSLVLFSEARPGAQTVCGVISHYLVEEAGFHVVRIGSPAPNPTSVDERVEDAVAFIRPARPRAHLDRRTRRRRNRRTRVRRRSHHDRVNGLLLLGVEDEDIPLAPLMPVLIIQGADDDDHPAGPRRAAAIRPPPSARA